MSRNYDPVKSKERQIERALAKLSSVRRARAKEGARKSWETRKRREAERRAAKAEQPFVYVPAPERERRAVERMRLTAARYDRSAERWRRSAERAEAAGDFGAAEKRRKAAANFDRRARVTREMADERESGVRRKLAQGAVEVRTPTPRKLALAAWKVLLARMEPGRWYRMGELRALMPEYAKGTVSTQAMYHLPRKGLMVKEENPDFDPSIPEKAMASGMYRYRIAGKAVSLAAEWRKELGIG